jgi:GH15 family glucan-1,4-alpha-glucosidase
LIGDCTTAALVGRNGSIDWLCWPRFDSGACFAALLGTRDHGRWLMTCADEAPTVSRSYREDTMILETLFETTGGAFAIIDFMPIGFPSSLIRIVEGRRGRSAVIMNMTLRFDYGSAIPWVTRLDDKHGLVAIAGPNLVVLRTTIKLNGEADLSTSAAFDVDANQRVAFVLTYGASHLPPPEAIQPDTALIKTEHFWRTWASQCAYKGAHRDVIVRSLLTLKALTYADTGGIVAAPTTSLPEKLGGQRNWDYRYCWLRDASLTLIVLMRAGYYEEARAWRDWLQRALAGSPADFQIMYGLAGERRLAEWEVPWLPGYQGAAPVLIGNAASGQLQLDVWGELMLALYFARRADLATVKSAWELQCQALTHLETIWNEPDDGIWEIRGARRHFTFSKVMAWVAFDRAIQDAEDFGLDAPLERWRVARDRIHKTVCDFGYDGVKGAFTQSFGSQELDATLLLLPVVGFLPIDDPRMVTTVAAVERELLVDGLLLRYRTESGADGLPPGEGVFLACSFWLADIYQMQGRKREAKQMIDKLIALRNDLGLLSEEYDPATRRFVGNFPQAFSHLALVRSLLNLQDDDVPAGMLPTKSA